ncbi:hypothetical protein ACHAXN_005151, partial [Cyclotella atomus]
SAQTGHKQNKQLGDWIKIQHVYYKKGIIPKDCERMLQGIGFEWQVINQNWIEQYQELVAFKATQGNCRVPIVYKDNKPLVGILAIRYAD